MAGSNGILPEVRMTQAWISALLQGASQMSRRDFLRGGALGALALAAGGLPNRAAGLAPVSSPFSLGIASGDPTDHSVTLWTLLTRERRNGPVEIEWILATDAGLKNVIKHGSILALPENAHSVHVEVNGLAPDRWYWYRFRSGADLSPIGRTRTFPALGSSPRALRFAFVSCQNWESGYYNAWQMLAQEDIDFVLHLGDYIYEVEASMTGVRQHA